MLLTNEMYQPFNESALSFRGKSIEDDSWVYGWYLRYPFTSFPPKPCIVPSNLAGEYKHIEIDVNSLGQFVGAYDRENKPIYTGDIVSNEYGKQQIVISSCGQFCFVDLYGFITYDFGATEIKGIYEKKFLDYRRRILVDTIVGNKFDNPELLVLDGENDNKGY